ncbi:unnamed protein product [Nippostrongylus brasiliensis]|uniref:WD_REPEATS_REGION domain-containing protein n=1 Tax=Nippostrongylus brasiliensis TaxID=27835 RepID=A0A158R1V8_NIPBR|nr:unnamed protein product [Nippostrongylus brasiliensis]
MDSNGPQPPHMGSTVPMPGGVGIGQGAIDELSEKQLTPEVLQILMTFLRKNGLAFVDSSFDFFQAEFSLLLFPVFAHSYIKLMLETSVANAREFFKRYSSRIPRPYEELVYNLERLQTPHQVQADPYVQFLMKNSYLVKMSKSSIKQLEIPLARAPTIKNIVKEHITIEASDVISKLRSSVESQMGGILGQVSKNEKRHKMYYGVLKDDVSQTIEKKKTRGKELKDSKKSQALAPVPDRIPLPPLSEALREERRKAMRDAAKLTLVSQESPPSVCMLTALNAYGGVSCCDISDDSLILCIGGVDGSIELTAFDEEQKLKKLRDMESLEGIDMDADNISELLYDDVTAKSEVSLVGHCGAVYSAHFSPDNRLLASCAMDKTIRLWSLETQKNVVVYRLNDPVWQFSPCGRYIISTARDGAVCVWDVAYQRLAGMETRNNPASIGSICFSRDGGCFAVCQGGESLSVYSLDNMIAATSNAASSNELCFDPKINMPNFNIFTYPTMQTSLNMRMAFPEGLTSPEMEIAEGGVILDNRTRFADLKSMLDSSKDNLKVDAMKRIINLIAKGKDVSELFPAVVKNVAAKNVELKKLVYVYLVRYAEEQQDLALLSISTFQRALKDPNQLIRASALRVLSSIRVGMIVPIMLLAIKDSVRDMSPYVAAHAIPKLYSLDPDLETELVDCIDFLLADRRSLVLGSAVYAFEEICPNRLDLLHKHFRALCRALADVDEWGQVMMINLLTRYARSELADPELLPQPDVDLTLLLNSARPLLQSRNCSVVMAVTQLFYYTAPKSQLSQNMFDPFLKSFFVRSSDPSFVKELKLHILTSLVSEANVHIILRELQCFVKTYVAASAFLYCRVTSDLAAAAIEAIGRCAVRVKAVSEQCLAGLVQLIASPNETVVCSAVIVLKRLLHAEAPVPLLSRLTRLIRSIQAPSARACIIWLVATHVETVPNLAPDLLRILAKNFVNEDEIVKVETLKLAVKLWMIRRDDCEKLVQCRFLRNLLFNTTVLAQHAEQIFMAKKPAPALQSSFKEREQFQLGTLSHALNQRCARYQDLPNFPHVSSDPSMRREANSPEEFKNDEGDLEDEDEEDEYEDEEYEEDEDEEGSVEAEEEEEEEEDEEGEGEGDEETAADESSEEEGSDEEGSEEDSEEERPIPPPVKTASSKAHSKRLAATNGHTAPEKKAAPKPTETAIDLLLDLDFSAAGSRQLVDPEVISKDSRAILNTIEGDGIEVSLTFPRKNDAQYTPLCFLLRNATDEPIEGIRFAPPGDFDVKGSLEIEPLAAGASRILNVSVDLGDSLRRVEWKLSRNTSETVRSVAIEVPIGEQVQPIRIPDEEVEKERRRMGGLNRHSAAISHPVSGDDVVTVINAYRMPNGMFTCQTRSRKDLVIMRLTDDNIEVSSDNAVFGKMLVSLVQSIANKSNTEPKGAN